LDETWFFHASALAAACFGQKAELMSRRWPVRIMPTTIPNTLTASRMRHLAVIGQAGAGKANLLSQLIQFDIANEHGLIQFDLDGDATDRVLSLVPQHRIKDVVLIDLSDIDYPPAVNPLCGSGSDYDTVIADHLVDAFKSIAGYDQMATPDMDRTIYNAARAIIDLPGGTLLDMYRMLVFEPVRLMIVERIRDPVVASYWQEQFARLEPREQAFITKSTVNKLEPFVSDRRIRNALGQGRPLVDFRTAVENRKIILIKVPQSEFGLNKSKIVSGLLLAQFFSLAQRRKGLLPFHVYLPQCQHLTGNTLHQMLATLGGRNVSIALSFQYLHQLGRLKEAVFGNVGNWIMFRVGLADALELEKLFEWDNTRKYLYELNYREIRLVTPNNNPLNFITLINNLNTNNNMDAIVKRSRHFYCRPSREVEPSINALFGEFG
jgi:hypothetical protein